MKALRGHKRKGQAILLILALVIVFLSMLTWIFSVNRYVTRKLRVQDGGDAAALAAARVQASGLNLVGELNLIKAFMLSTSEDVQAVAPAVQSVSALQERLRLTTPLQALAAAQHLAEANHLDALPMADVFLEDFAQYIRLDSFYEGAEDDFRAMMRSFLLQARQSGGVRVFPLSGFFEADFYSYLTDQDFYEAILARDWCWFWFHAYPFLQRYSTRQDFGQLPDFDMRPFFDLRLTTQVYALEEIVSLNTEDAKGRAVRVLPLMQATMSRLEHPNLKEAPEEETLDGFTLPVAWTVYKATSWGPWRAMERGVLPLEGELKECYNYAGCNAAVSVTKDGATWIAAAKAFGDLEGENPTIAGLALGGYHDVRLIPVDAADRGIRGFDYHWLTHVYFHLPEYLKAGWKANGCRYCHALSIWEDPAFRMTAIDWLSQNGRRSCRRKVPPGPGPSGGSAYAH